MSETGLVYPAPSLVVGIGRFGLAVLERLGEDWQQLRLSGADLSLENLRLLWLHPENGCEDCWRKQDRELKRLRIARYIQDGDLPSIALDFVLLRTLGLVRYRHGIYQVAVPKDRGPVRVSDLGVEVVGEGAEDKERLVRRRYFAWQNLDPDPLRAAEELRRQAEHQGSLHLFIAPLINRIRQGHSPWILLAVVQRCQALTEGRDPSPWRWVRNGMLDSDRSAGRTELSRTAIDEARSAYRAHDALLDGLAPAPLRPRERRSKDGEWAFAETEVVVPAILCPHRSDPETPIDPFHLLNEDWEATGWAADLADDGNCSFKTLRVSHFRLGLFDHGRAEGAENALGKGLGRRLRKLADLLHKALVRLWVDLDREQVEERTPLPLLKRHDNLDEALEQSLKMLYELVVCPLERKQEGLEDEKLADGLRYPDELPPAPSVSLQSLYLDTDFRDWHKGALDRRLQALGLVNPQRRPPATRTLLRQVTLRHAADSKDAPRVKDPSPISMPAPSRRAETSIPGGNQGGDEDPAAGCDASDTDTPSLRKVLNQGVRDLLNFSYLGAYRKRATRTPPRLTVFVVGDMSEPFTRLKMTDVLRDVHSELLRSFSSMFELHREGFDRALSIVPILWMPHPADPFGGEPLEKTRLEEAVIIDSVHRVRRWVESVLPGARRRISQIFINGRVTDNAVLTVEDSIQQTRDFLAFQIRNDLSRDDWLRRTAVGPGGDDFFASFACCEIEFPAERAREYLANRLVRDCLHRLRGRPQQTSAEEIAGPPPPPEEDVLVREAVGSLIRNNEKRAQELVEGVRQALPAGAPFGPSTPSRTILRSYDLDFERRLWQGIRELWQELTLQPGRMDSLVDDLRCRVSGELRQTLSKIRQSSDEDIEQASRRGLPAIMARIEERRRVAFSSLQETEERRRHWEQASKRHRRPRRAELAQARNALVRAAHAKPDVGPQRLGLLSWALQAPVTGSLLTALLVPLLGASVASIISPIAVTLSGAAFLRIRTHRGHRRVRLAIEQLSESVRRLVAGGDADRPIEAQQPSVRSFLETRLRLTSALARRGYASHAFEQAALDEKLGHRLQESLEIQEYQMERRAEDLGVRPASPGADVRDDLRNLFVRRQGEPSGKLIDPGHLLEYYRSRVRPDDLPLSEFLDHVGGFGEWRKNACLSDAEAIMRYGRERFGAIATRPITELDYFSESAGDQLRAFVRRNYSNIGFGAKFLGYEGLDPDGVRLSADASLVAGGALIAAYELAEERAEEAERLGRPHQSRPRTLERLVAQVRPNAAYMFSLVQGIRAHSVHNLKRFESFHDRSEECGQDPPAIHLFTGYQDCGEILLDRVQSIEKELAVERVEEIEVAAQSIQEDGDGMA